jgi:hypothetical protein
MAAHLFQNRYNGKILLQKGLFLQCCRQEFSILQNFTNYQKDKNVKLTSKEKLHKESPKKIGLNPWFQFGILIFSQIFTHNPKF